MPERTTSIHRHPGDIFIYEDAHPSKIRDFNRRDLLLKRGRPPIRRTRASQVILDSSPLVAILPKEPDAELCVQAISRAPLPNVGRKFPIDALQLCNVMRCFAESELRSKR